MRRTLAYLAIIVLVSVAVFLNTMPNEFHLDDYYRVADNPGIQTVWPPWRHFVDPRTMSTLPQITQFRPLLPLTLSVNYAIAGDSLPGYHLGNLLFQIVASLLLYFLVLELLRQTSDGQEPRVRPEYLALATASLFAVHPVSGILVNYICARDLILMEMFLLAAFLGYVRMRRLGDSWWRWALILAALALALLSKTNAVVLPLLVLLFEIVVRRESWARPGPWLRALPFGAVAAAFFFYTRFVLGFSDLAAVTSNRWHGTLEYALTQANLHVLVYLPNFFLPHRIHMPAGAEPAGFLDPGALLGVVFILATLIAAWMLRRRTPLVSFCILAYWTLLIPTSSMVPLLTARVDYRPYPASPFLFLCLGLLAVRYLKPRLCAILFVALLAWFGVSSVLMNRVWRTDRTLFTHSVKMGPTALGLHELGMASDDLEERVGHLEEALRLNPNYVLAHTNLGLALVSLGREEEGIAHCRKAVALRPGSARAQYWLSRAYDILGRKDEALVASHKAAALDPRNLKYLDRAARDSQAAGDSEGSLPFLEASIGIQPGYRRNLFLKGFALQKMGRLEEAVADYRRSLQVDPEDFQAWFNLGHALMSLGRCGEAVECFRKTLDLKPDYREVHYHLSRCYGELGAPEAADRHETIYREDAR